MATADWKHEALNELGEADRAYRAAFRELTSAGGFRPSSFRALLSAARRLEEIARRLERHEQEEPPGPT